MDVIVVYCARVGALRPPSLRRGPIGLGFLLAGVALGVGLVLLGLPFFAEVVAPENRAEKFLRLT